MERNSYFDNLKALAIFLVILTHLFMPMYSSTDEFVRWIYNFTFLIHMPIFFYVSGHFAKLDVKKIFTRLFYPYCLFQVVMFFFYFVTNISALDIYFPLYSLWYLLVLSLFLCFTPFLKKVEKLSFKILIFSLSLIFALLFGFLPLPSILGTLSRAVCLFPFFLFGFFFKNIGSVFSKKIFKVVGGIVLCVIFILTFFLFKGIDMDLVFYLDYSYAPIYYRVLRLLFSFLALCSLLALVPYKKSFFSSFGERSKTIYLYHVYIAFPLSFLYNHYDTSFVKIFVMLGVSVLIFLLLGNKYFHKFTKYTTSMYEFTKQRYLLPHKYKSKLYFRKNF